MAPKKKSFILTKSNYYSKDRPHISNSQVSDFLKSKEYYWRRHVLHEVEYPSTPAMRIGSIADDLITGQFPRYGVKVLKKENPELYALQKDMPDDLLVTEKEWQEGHNLANAIMKEPCFAWYGENNAKFQVPLTGTWKDIPICGLADVITETETAIYIDDIKTTSAAKISSLKKWYFNCLEFGYLRQLAAYVDMYKQMHPEEEREIITRHLVATKEAEGLYKVYPIVIPKELLMAPLDLFFYGVEGIHELLVTENWHDEPVYWEDAYTLYDSNNH